MESGTPLPRLQIESVHEGAEGEEVHAVMKFVLGKLKPELVAELVEWMRA